MSIELYFLINQAADFAIMAAAARGMGCFRFRRVALGSCVAALYAVLALRLPWLKGPVWQAALLIPVARLTAGRASPWFTGVTALTLCAMAMAAGGLAAGLRAPWLALVVPAALSMQCRLRRRTLSALPTQVEVVHRGAVARFPACVDTGNHLTEPFSGQPVMIVNAALIRALLPAKRYRLVGYGSVGGQGVLRCFRPDGIYLLRRGRRRRAPEAWIAVYPARMPGVAQALAPAEFIYIY